MPPPQPPSDSSGAPPPTPLDGPPTAGMCVCVFVCSGGVCIALNHCCSVCCATAVLADGAGAGAGAGAGPQHSAAGEGPAESEDAFFSKAQGVAMGMLVRAVDKVQVTFSMRQLRNAVIVLVSRVWGAVQVGIKRHLTPLVLPGRHSSSGWLLHRRHCGHQPSQHCGHCLLGHVWHCGCHW